MYTSSASDSIESSPNFTVQGVGNVEPDFHQPKITKDDAIGSLGHKVQRLHCSALAAGEGRTAMSLHYGIDRLDE